jgi:putative peptidoglycan lipid II flippase
MGRKENAASTFIVMTCTFISRILGFVRTAVITAIFGAGGKADVINATFAVPNNLRKLLAEGALSSAFIPVLGESIQHETDRRESSKPLVNTLISFQLLILLPLTTLSIVFARPLVKYVITQFSDPGQIDLSIRLFRFFIGYLLLISINSVLMALLNSHDRFFIPAFTPIFFSISVILSILLLHNSLGVFSMAVGVLLGGAGQILFQIPLFKALGYGFRLNFSFSNPQFKTIISRWLPVLATSSIFTINQQVAFILASGLETGSVSGLSYALVFWQLPFGLFSASVTTVLFPRMSREATTKDHQVIGKTLQYGLRFLFVLLIPSALFLFFFGPETISMALQRGRFSTENTLMTATILRAYCWGLFSVGAFQFLQRFFYANKHYKIPFIAASITVIIDIILSLILKETSLKVSGLAHANSIAFTIGTIILLFYSTRLIDLTAYLKNFLSTLAKVTLSMWPMLLLFVLRTRFAEDWWIGGSSLGGLLTLLGCTAVLGLLVLLMYRLTKIEMFSSSFFPRRKP